jgi:hypothetical protein
LTRHFLRARSRHVSSALSLSYSLHL